jgi:DNA-binding GntR family transcriptional regulator
MAALERRDPDAVAEELGRHFDEVRENMARRWPDESAHDARPPHDRKDA